MRFSNILIGIVLPVAALTAWLWVGFQKTNQANLDEGRDQVTFDQYVLAWASGPGSADLSHLPGGGVTALADMFPEAPEGWTRRTVSRADGKALAVRGLDARRQALLKDAAIEDSGAGVEQASAAWDTPDGVLVAELVRYPDTLFATPVGVSLLDQNRAPFGQIGNQPLMNIAGLEIREALLAPQIPARVLRAGIDGQIVLRVSAPKRISDETLLSFFATLNVAAMNARLAAPIAGMGEVKDGKKRLAVLVAGMSDAQRAVLEEAGAGFSTDYARLTAAREALRAGLSEAGPVVAEGEPGAAIAAAPKETVAIRRGVAKNDPGRSSFRTGGKDSGLQDDCKKVGGRKTCGVAAPQAE
ncbi:hypothetical protein [Rhodobacter sp. 24-YEA-8]|uniref:hypothetical protein n=1 Tax=Rhodobacter sp. 24-YEA-8 TaxID=1884310 RepID=UPI000899BD14|nr:hypothetical protein [Rhodobacter sp. 24-YEA-8]SEC09586.1 hypothetical protein SAMN05519105_1940 [Rhodobacter sp. 24-YEA-8]